MPFDLTLAGRGVRHEVQCAGAESTWVVAGQGVEEWCRKIKVGNRWSGRGPTRPGRCCEWYISGGELGLCGYKVRGEIEREYPGSGWAGGVQGLHVGDLDVRKPHQHCFRFVGSRTSGPVHRRLMHDVGQHKVSALRDSNI